VLTGVTVGVARVAAGGVISAGMAGMMAAAVVTGRVPVLEAEQSHRSQPGGAEGKCEGVNVHGGDDPVGGYG
jgi:hypothetical protein